MSTSMSATSAPEIPTGYIIGAGFSKAVSEHMPTTFELGEAVTNAIKTSDPVRAAILPKTEDVELLLTYLAEQQPWLDAKENLINRAMFLRISELISYLLIERQEKAIEEIKSAPSKNTWPLKGIHYWLRHPTCLVSLNYDVLIEWIYQTVLGTGFSYEDLYATAIPSIVTRDGRSKISSAHNQLSVILYKLHGSINWLYSGSDTFSGEQLYNSGFIPLALTDKSLMAINRDQEIRRLMKDKVPFVVPPTLHKEIYYKNEIVRTQWRDSLENLSLCEEIFILGYSLPKSDLMMRFYLSKVIESENVKRVYIVNNNPDHGDNYEEVFKGVESKCDKTYLKLGDPIQELFNKRFV